MLGASAQSPDVIVNPPNDHSHNRPAPSLRLNQPDAGRAPANARR